MNAHDNNNNIISIAQQVNNMGAATTEQWVQKNAWSRFALVLFKLPDIW